MAAQEESSGAAELSSPAADQRKLSRARICLFSGMCDENETRLHAVDGKNTAESHV
jgi:hypothetical protein